MSDNDLIRRGDALDTIRLGDTVTKLQARIAAIPAVDAEPVCTCCGGTGITCQTERRCACQGPDLSDPIAVHANMLRGTIAKPTVEQIIHLYGVDALVQALEHVNETPKSEHDAGNVLTPVPDAACDRIGTQAVGDLEAKLAKAEWLLTDAAVQLEEGKIKTRRNRAGLIWQFLAEIKGP